MGNLHFSTILVRLGVCALAGLFVFSIRRVKRSIRHGAIEVDISREPLFIG